jgi:hypothetical protein
MIHSRRTFLARAGAMPIASLAMQHPRAVDATPMPQPAPEEQRPSQVEHVTIWREANRYGGWPTNHGMWIWGDELVVGFSAGHLSFFDPNRHPIDRTRAEEHMLARSSDGGRTWRAQRHPDLVPPPEPGHMSGVPTEPGGRMPRTLDTALDFSAPGFAMTLRMADNHTGPSWFYATHDRGQSWSGPWALPHFGTPGITARTSYVVMGPRHLVATVTAAKPNGREGRPLAIETHDGGLTWTMVGWMGEETDGWRIMPSTARLRDGRLYSAVRRRDGDRHLIEGVVSGDGGRTWHAAGTPVPDAGRGNPGALLLLADGRLCLSYGHRAKPYGIRAVLSDDDGRTWGEPIVLREDGADWDVGYPAAVQHADGRIITAYYFTDAASPERFIAATLWRP